MRCPKCGHENPSETLFCEECDWRLDQMYRPEKKRNPFMFAVLSLVIGAAAAASYFASGVAALLLGIVGLLLGSYSINIPRYLNPDNKTLCIALAGVGTILSVIGFILGFATVAGAF